MGDDGGGSGIDPRYGIPILLAAVAVHAPLLIGLSSRGRSSYDPVRRFILSCMSAAYFPLISYVLSYLPAYLSSMLKPSSSTEENKHNQTIEELPILKWILIAPVLLSLILIQYLKAKADMAALAVSAVTSPVAARDDIDRLKIRPSIESIIYSFWVAGVVIYSLVLHYSKETSSFDDDRDILVYIITPLIAPLWVLGACRMVLRFAIFQMASSSFAVGRNSQLIEGHMFQVVEVEEARKLSAEATPRLIVTGERKEDVEETPLGYQIKPSALEDKKGSLITLDRVWSCGQLKQKHKDLCLSLALFKCLRRRFAGRRLAEAGSDWAFKFVSNGLLDAQGDPERIFRVIADELSFVSGFYYAPLPVASLGTFSAALHFFLSFLISALFCFLTLLLLVAAIFIYLTTLSVVAATSVLAFVLAAVNAVTEISDMVAGVRSNWTKISIIGHFIRCRPSCRVQRIFFWLLRREPSKIWKDKMGQVELLKPILSREQPWARFFLRIQRKHRHNMTVVNVPLEVKKAILASLRNIRELGQQQSDSTDTVRLRCQAFYPGGGEVPTTTEAILVWHIATRLFELRYSASSSTSAADNVIVAQRLSRYCAYLVVEAPDLLPDNSAWVKRLCKELKKGIDAASKSIDAVQDTGVLYERQIACFSDESSHQVLKIASKLAEELRVDTRARDEEAVWKFLKEFWSEMLLYLAPSDDVKHHIEALQRGGELISLLRALLLHAGIIDRPSLKLVAEP
ncbi:hypothetical protein BS78_05G255500 [Paspalum vaginatum]|nr:hypothetical protein BS78_05G255500 [Paspalum vaginatum]